jgi:hypothetical protein
LQPANNREKIKSPKNRIFYLPDNFPERFSALLGIVLKPARYYRISRHGIEVKSAEFTRRHNRTARKGITAIS